VAIEVPLPDAHGLLEGTAYWHNAPVVVCLSRATHLFHLFIPNSPQICQSSVSPTILLPPLEQRKQYCRYQHLSMAFISASGIETVSTP
jgi:hypothetical protein